MRKIQITIQCRTANKIPRQKNTTDCGIFICKYAEYISQDIENMDFTQQQISDIRKQMKIEIASGKLLEHKIYKKKL